MSPKQKIQLFQVENIEDFKRLCEINCQNDDEIMDMVELRRKTKNRVSFQFHFKNLIMRHADCGDFSSYRMQLGVLDRNESRL